MDGIRQIIGYPGDTWDALNWDTFSKEEKEAWGILGWNRASWEEETSAPPSDGKYWAHLTAAERLAAQALGYVQASWNA